MSKSKFVRLSIALSIVVLMSAAPALAGSAFGSAKVGASGQSYTWQAGSC